MSQPPPLEQEYAGQRLGLPAEGPGSVASWGRRLAALFVDWLASTLVAIPLLGYEYGASVASQGWRGFAPFLVFALQSAFFTALLGGSFGQLVFRVVVVRLDNRPVNLLQALLRSALILLVVPPLVFNRDNRGLHDLAVGTIVLTR